MRRLPAEKFAKGTPLHMVSSPRKTPASAPDVRCGIAASSCVFKAARQPGVSPVSILFCDDATGDAQTPKCWISKTGSDHGPVFRSDMSVQQQQGGL